MGMFDEVQVLYPLPGNPPAFKAWQSKSAECGMATYRITGDGRLERLAGSSHGEQFAADGDGIPPRCEEKWVDQEWHGSFRICSSTTWPSGDMREWWEFHLIFIDGKIVDPRRVNTATRDDPTATAPKPSEPPAGESA